MKITKDVRWLNQRIGAELAAQLGADGLTPTQMLALEAAHVLDGANQSQLVAATLIDRSTLSDVLRRLASAGMVSRADSKEDARMWVVSVTPAGLAAFKLAKPKLLKVELGLRLQAKAMAAAW